MIGDLISSSIDISPKNLPARSVSLHAIPALNRVTSPKTGGMLPGINDTDMLYVV